MLQTRTRSQQRSTSLWSRSVHAREIMFDRTTPVRLPPSARLWSIQIV